MAHLHDMRDMDTHFVIDPISRAITNPDSPKNALMMGDHNSEIYTFELPKVVEGHDMSLCNRVEIHYTNISSDKANKTEDVYPVSDMQLAEDSTDTLVFSWLISGNATKYPGLLSFRIRFGGINASGVYNYKWHTQIFKSVTVSDGFDNTEAVVEEYSDTIAEWEARLDALEEGGSGVEVTAKPGQLIRVKETDENGKPTVWEAVPWGYTEGEMAEILPECQPVFDGTTGLPNAGYITQPFALIIGERYTVVFNGTEYKCVCQDAGALGEMYSGVPGLMNEGVDVETEEGLVFGILNTGGGSGGVYGLIVLPAEPTEAVTLSIRTDEIHHPIPSELLPEGVPYVYKGYLLEETDAVESTDPTFGKNWVITKSPSLTVGETYTIIYNGVPYDCVCDSGDDYNLGFAKGAFLMGNKAAIGGTNTGEPFAMVVFPSIQIVSLDLTGATSVRIGIMGKVGNKMDDRCMPDTARVLVVKFAEREDGNLVSTSHTREQIIKELRRGIPVVGNVEMQYSFSTVLLFTTGSDGYVVDVYNGYRWSHPHGDGSAYDRFYVDGDTSNKTIGNEIWEKYTP